MAIVISHPHYFATNLHWGEAFGCPVYLSAEDKEWAVRLDESKQVFWSQSELHVPDGEGETDLVAIKTGGHFPGSTVLWWKSLRKLLVADSILVVPSGIYHVDRPPGTASFTFMWSYPNMVCFLGLFGYMADIGRFLFLLVRCIISGKRSNIPILTKRMVHSSVRMLGEMLGNVYLRARRSSSGRWDIWIMLYFRRRSMLPGAMK